MEPIALDFITPTKVATGAEVPIRVKVHNGSARPIAVGFGAQRGFNVIVAVPGSAADSGAVWSIPVFTESKVGREATITDPLLPGRDTVFSVVWPGVDDGGRRVRPGTYRIRATVSAELVSTRQLWTEWRSITIGQ